MRAAARTYLVMTLWVLFMAQSVLSAGDLLVIGWISNRVHRYDEQTANSWGSSRLGG